jgi:hypothetical protein
MLGFKQHFHTFANKSLLENLCPFIASVLHDLYPMLFLIFWYLVSIFGCWSTFPA